MKKLLLISALIALVVSSYSQAPNAFNYQAVLRNADGTVKANEQVNLGINIIKDSIDGPVVYDETHNTQSNNFGLVTLIIGGGDSEHSIDSIDWSTGTYFLEVLVNGISLGTKQFLSVPYALYASEAGEVTSLYYDFGSLKFRLTGVTESGYEFDEEFECKYGEVKFPSYFYLSEYIDRIRAKIVIMATQGTDGNSIYFEMGAFNIVDLNKFVLENMTLLYNKTLDDGSIFNVNTYFSGRWDDFLNIEEFNTITGVFRGQFETDVTSHPSFDSIHFHCDFDIMLKNSRLHSPKQDEFIF